MKVLVYSDLHLESVSFQVSAEALEAADVVVLAGDIHGGMNGYLWAREHLAGKQVIYVAGNHEFYWRDRPKLIESLRAAACTDASGIHFLERDGVVIDGVRFLGTTLWTDFSVRAQKQLEAADVARGQAHDMHEAWQVMNDYADIREAGADFMPADALREHLLSVAWLKEQLSISHEGPTVVVTHHGPSDQSAWDGLRMTRQYPAYVSELGPDLFSMTDLWIHGHIHVPVDYVHHGCRVLSNPRGYPSRYPNWAGQLKKFDSCRVVELSSRR